MIELNALLIQGVGALGGAGDLYASTRKKDRLFMGYIAVSSLVWALHYALLGAWSAVGSDILTAARYTSALYFNKAFIAIAFMLFYLIAIPITYQTPVDILPYFCGFISTYALFYLSGIHMRYIFIISHIAWIIYAYEQGSIPGLFLNTGMILGHINTIRHLKRA